MEISPILQAYLMLYCFLFGGCIGVVGDIFAAVASELKKRIERVGGLRWLFDFFLCLLSSTGLILLSYYFNKGSFRFFSLLGFCTGLVLYRFTLSFVVKKIIGVAFSLVCTLLRFIFTPIQKICIKMAYFLIKTKYYMQKRLEKIFKMVYNISVQRKVISRARKGFVKDRRALISYKRRER